jgi:hypothetical protein
MACSQRCNLGNSGPAPTMAIWRLKFIAALGGHDADEWTAGDTVSGGLVCVPSMIDSLEVKVFYPA